MLRCKSCKARRFQVKDDFTIVCDECGSEIPTPSEAQRNAQFLQDRIHVHLALMALVKADLWSTFEAARQFRIVEPRFSGVDSEVQKIYTELSTLENRLGEVYRTLREEFQISGYSI